MIELFARRLAGLCLIALAALLPIVIAARLSSWENTLAGRKSVQPLGIADVAVVGTALWGIILVGLWWHWRRTTMWSVWARWASATGLFAALLDSVRLAGDRGQPIALVIWLGLLLACWALGEAARLVTTRPVTAGLIASKLEIPFPTRDLKARLCVREDRLVLDSLASRRKRSRDVIAVPWTALRSIELVDVEQEMVCQVLVFSNRVEANAREFDVRPGPALHVIGTARELLIPVTEQVGQSALAAVRARSAGVELEEPLTEENWSSRTGVYRGRDPKGNYRTDSRPYILGIVGAFLLMPLFMLSGMTLSLITGSARMQDQFYADGGVVKPANVVVLGIGSIMFLYLLHRFVIKAFIKHMKVQDFIEAFPEPPPPLPKTGTVPGSGKKRKKR